MMTRVGLAAREEGDSRLAGVAGSYAQEVGVGIHAREAEVDKRVL